MHIDPFTTTVFTILISFMMSLGLFFTHKYLREVKGIAYGATALLWMGLAWLLLALNGVIGNFLSLVIGTVFGLLGCIFNIHALAAFKQQCVSMRWLYALVVITFIGNTYFIEINFNMAAKIVVTSIAVAILQFTCAVLLFSKWDNPYSHTHRLTGTFFAIGSCIYAIRAVYYFVWNTKVEQHFFHVNLIQELTYLTNLIVIVGTSFGFALMCIEKYIAEKNHIQELLQTAQDAAQMQSYVTDLRTGIFNNTPELNAIYGVDRHFSHSIESFKKILHPDDCQRVINRFQDSIAKQEKYISMEYRTISPITGQIHWIAAWGINFYDNQNNPLQQIGMIQDITERKHIELTQQALINRNQLLMDNAPEGIHIVDAQGKVLEANSTFCDLLGYNKTEVLNLNVADWEAKITGEQLQATLKQLLHTKATFETQHRRKDGQIIDVEVNIIGVDLDGKPCLFALSKDITERKQMERALKDNEAFTVSILNSLTTHIAVLDTTGKIVMINQAWQQFSEKNGMSSDYQAMLNTNYFEPCQRAIGQNNGEEAYAVLQGIKAVIAGELPEFSIEYPCHSPSQQRWFYMNVSPLQGSRQGVVVSHVNITERKQIEQQLKENEQRFRLIFDNANVGMCLVNTQGRLFKVNHQMCQIFGYSQAELEAMSVNDLAYPEYKSVSSIFIQQATTGQTEHAEFEKKYRHKNGHIVWGLVSSSIVKNETGKALYFISHVIDITERKQAEIELRIAATVFESQEGMLITNAEGIILKVNHAFTRITGYSGAETIGKKPKLLSSGRHDAAFYKGMWQSIYETGIWQGEIWNRRKNGEIYPQWLTITAVKTNNDEIITHYVATLVDITQRKAAEETIKRLAFYDPLTQLPNRRLLYERLQQEIDNNKQIAVLILDLDKFKAVNDNLGHAAGDELLQQVAQRINACVRDSDTVARFGGDEFVVLINDVNHREQVNTVAMNIINILKQVFILQGQYEAWIGTSIGIALYPQHGNNLETLINHADSALYCAKDNGRGCFTYFSEA